MMRFLYRFLSILGDLKAALRGPGALGRRYGRKWIIKKTGGWSRKRLKP